ncbi:MAG: hypothetical protein QOG90_354 [Actinomycetota bacterium]|jgi:hypothetical protein
MLNRWLCALALVVTAVIHLAVVPEHLHEWPAAGVFFVVLSIVELGLAAAVVRGKSRTTFLVGGAISVASAALWMASRTVGLPIGPEAFSPEAIAAPDVFATVLEALAAVVFVRLAAQPRTAPIRARVHS